MWWRCDVGIFKGARLELSDMSTQGSEGARGRRESGRKDGGLNSLSRYRFTQIENLQYYSY